MADTQTQPSSNAENVEPESRESQATRLYQTAILLLYGKRRSVDRAIKCVQKAITFIDTNYKYWQLLGEAYYRRGNLNPAINCFMKSLSLADSNPIEQDADRLLADCTHSRLRMSDIRLSVGHFEDASIGYNDIIKSQPDNVAALIGLAKTELQLARRSFSSGLVRTGHEHCKHALTLSLRSVKLSPNLCLTWKLASDCCLLQFVSGRKGQYSMKLGEHMPAADDHELVINRLSCIEIAQQFLCKAISIAPFEDSSCLWHNLGVALYLKSTIVDDASDERQLLERSLKCLLRALDKDRPSSQIRNSIGVVSAKLNLLNTGQSFLIKSIQTNMSTSELQFSNLGYVYLQSGRYETAAIAFNRCQAEEPMYSRSWLGHALVLEHNKIDNVAQLRHCHRIDSTYIAQTLYASKVLSSPKTPNLEKDYLDALDGMTRAIDYDDKSAVANTLLGLLFEHNSQLDNARRHFHVAHIASQKDARAIFNKLRLTSTKSPDCSKGDRFHDQQDNQQLIKTAEIIAKTRSVQPDHLLNYIYYLFNNSDFVHLNNAVTKFIDKLSPEDYGNKVGAQILLGLAAKHNQSDFKSWLFKNIIDLEGLSGIEAVINLACLMLFGVLTGDLELVKQITEDLYKHILVYISSSQSSFLKLFHSKTGYWIRYVLLCSCFVGTTRTRFIKPIVAMFPTIAELWLYQGLAFVLDGKDFKLALECMQKADAIGFSNSGLTMSCDILMAILSQISWKPGVKSWDGRPKFLSRAIYKYPDYPLLWEAISVGLINKPSKKSDLLSGNNSKLLELAISHTIRMIAI